MIRRLRQAAAVLAAAAFAVTVPAAVAGHRVAYTFNGLVNGCPGTGGTGTHPNLAGITSFYVPTLTSALLRTG